MVMQMVMMRMMMMTNNIMIVPNPYRTLFFSIIWSVCPNTYFIRRSREISWPKNGKKVVPNFWFCTEPVPNPPFASLTYNDVPNPYRTLFFFHNLVRMLKYLCYTSTSWDIITFLEGSVQGSVHPNDDDVWEKISHTGPRENTFFGFETRKKTYRLEKQF